MAVYYYICAVHYQAVGNERYIARVKTTYDLSAEMSSSTERMKAAVVSDIESGRRVKTKYKYSYAWLEGEDVRVVNGDSGYRYLRTDGNDIRQDNLGNLPEY